jgi:hypothetical protein
MKTSLKTIRFILATVLIVIISQASVFAEGNKDTTNSSGLNAIEVIGGIVILLSVLVLPLVKSSNREISRK